MVSVIVVYNLEAACKVSKFWKEVSLRRSRLELVEDESQSWAATGVLCGLVLACGRVLPSRHEPLVGARKRASGCRR